MSAQWRSPVRLAWLLAVARMWERTILVAAGILTREQRGKWAYYRLVPGALDALAVLITSPTV